jgi:hypothetical protein
VGQATNAAASTTASTRHRCRTLIALSFIRDLREIVGASPPRTVFDTSWRLGPGSELVLDSLPDGRTSSAQRSGASGSMQQ